MLSRPPVLWGEIQGASPRERNAMALLNELGHRATRYGGGGGWPAPPRKALAILRRRRPLAWRAAGGPMRIERLTNFVIPSAVARTPCAVHAPAQATQF